MGPACRNDSEGKQSILQLGLELARGFLEDKIRRPSAEDLLVEEDVKALPKVCLEPGQSPIPVWSSCAVGIQLWGTKASRP